MDSPKYLPTTDPRPDCPLGGYAIGSERYALPRHRCSAACDMTRDEALAYMNTQRIHTASFVVNEKIPGSLAYAQRIDPLARSGRLSPAQAFVLECRR